MHPQPALTADPRHAIAALERGDLATAEAIATELVQNGDRGDGLYLLGMVRSFQGDNQAASILLCEAADILPNRAEIAFNLGIVLRDLGDLSGAKKSWGDLVARVPAHADAWLNLGAVTEDLDGEGAALSLYQRALGHLPQSTALLYNAGELCYRRGSMADAADFFRRLLNLDPGFARAWVNLGMALKRLGRPDDAETCCRHVLALGNTDSTAVAALNLATLLLTRGCWSDGFAAWEARLHVAEAVRPDWNLPRWTGREPPGTRVLLWNDQGMGDAVQFLRYADQVTARGYRVFTYTRDAVKPLAQRAAGVEAAFGLSDPRPPADVELPVCSLPHALGLASPFGRSGPYLDAADGFGTPILPPAPFGDRRIGLVWAGNPAHVNDANRSAALDQLGPLFSVPNIVWYSLQTSSRAADLRGIAAPIVDLSGHLTDLAATAAILAELDLLVTVDTAIAHVAGATGCPAWVLLPATETDWRWGLADERTEWYPSLRLFRQEQSGDWVALAQRVANLLAAG